MNTTVSIPVKEYKILVRCRDIVEADFEENFTEEFVSSVRKSERAYRKGEFVRCNTRAERIRLFQGL